ncbi:integrase, catalytic region, zinc finger, CCHC-type containing protein [Tanacetum coccineum]
MEPITPKLLNKRTAHSSYIKHTQEEALVLKETVRRIRTDNGTEFVNQTLREYYEMVGISHETSVAQERLPVQDLRLTRNLLANLLR